MQTISLTKHIYRYASGVPTEMCQEAQKRFETLDRWHFLREQGLKADAAAKAVGAKRATLFRWDKTLRNRGGSGLNPASCRPINCRKPDWNMGDLGRVRAMRNRFPTVGRRNIRHYLAAEGAEFSEAAVGRMLRKLIAEGKVQPAAAFVGRGPTVKRHKRKRPHAQRFPSGFKPKEPGDVVQVDTMFVSLLPGKQIAHFNACDYISRWNVGISYASHASKNATDFLRKMLARMPFKIRAIQVDGGSEFMAEFEAACKELDIKLWVLPPRSPNLNGRVERINWTWRYEFFCVYNLPVETAGLASPCRNFENHYNLRRPHQALGYLTPAAYIRANFPGVEAA